jgi:hypothetical protein
MAAAVEGARAMNHQMVEAVWGAIRAWERQQALRARVDLLQIMCQSEGNTYCIAEQMLKQLMEK